MCSLLLRVPFFSALAVDKARTYMAVLQSICNIPIYKYFSMELSVY